MCPCCSSSRGGSAGIIAIISVASVVTFGSTRHEPPAPKNNQPAVKPAEDKKAEPAKGETKAGGASSLAFTVKSIDEKDVDLAQAYQGKVVMIVNVASRCGFTGQYEGLEKLYKEKSDKGFVILGFPANNFGGQEPGTNDEIAKFCQSKYNVTFPMFAKISVKGDDQHPLYKMLASQPAPVGGDPKWNFTKFIVDRTGKVAARFDSSVRPNDKDMVAKIDELLAAK